MNIIGISGLHNSVLFKKQNFPDLSPRQYRIAQGFDSAAALVTEDGIMAAAAQERFTGEKGTGSFPVDAIKFCLKYANLKPDDINYIAHGFSYEPFQSFIEDSNDFDKKQFKTVYSEEALLRNVGEYLPDFNWEHKIVRVPHHLAHAASSFYLSGLADSLILIADGMGEFHSTTIAIGKGNDISIIEKIPTLNSLGILYGVFTLYLGFYMNFDEYKVMGLAPYGNPRRFFSQIMDIVHLKNDGTFTIPMLFQNASLQEKETYTGTLGLISDMFGPSRIPGTEITQVHKDIAAALQAVLQASLMHILRHFKKETGQRNLCMAGGVALNCTANGIIKRSKMFERVFVQPASGDDGTSLGAALYVKRIFNANQKFSPMSLPFWGPSYETNEVEQVLRHQDCENLLFSSFDLLAAETARRIANGQIIAWFQGRMEFGPRALGNRSILVDPRDIGMRERLNRIIKKREDFRPFAPAVPVEFAKRFFEVDDDVDAYAYMLFVAPVRSEYQDKLPAITHIDGSARLQTVSSNDNPRFWTLLNEFGKISGMPVLLNTSFNIRGQPIVCTPTEAIDTFLSTEIDALVLGDYLVLRK